MGCAPGLRRPERWLRQAPPALEHQVIAYALEPKGGGWAVSASGVYAILCRHGVRTRWERLTRLESPLASLRLRTDAAKRFKRVDRATAVIGKMLMVAQKRFRRLKAPGMLAKVSEGVRFKDGVEVTEKEVAT